MDKTPPKTILFVDDRPPTIAGYIARLKREDPEISIEQVHVIEDAYNMIAKEGKKFDFILIDLNNPPVPPALEKPYGEKLPRLDLNHGQALGMWLSDKHKNTAYAYLSAMPVVMNDEVGFSQGDEKIQIIDKNSLLPRDFYKVVCDIYQSW